MELKKASKKQIKIKVALNGSSGSGKTTSALLMAYGMCGNWSKIAVIDTENRSSELYVGKKVNDIIIGEFQTIQLQKPYAPEKYIEALELCLKEPSVEVVLVDSMSHEWDGSGGILDIHNAMTGNSFTNWAKLTPRHNKLIETIINANKNVIGTFRSKQDYVMQEKNGKQVPEKVGLKAITREGVDYEFTLCFDIDIKHNAVASKDRTGLFMDNPDFIISAETGKKLVDWANSGVDEVKFICDTILKAQNRDDLNSIWANNKSLQNNEKVIESFKKASEKFPKEVKPQEAK